MMRAAFASLWNWIKTTLWPMTGKLMVDWWHAIGDEPALHAVSMFVGMVLLLAVKFIT